MSLIDDDQGGYRLEVELHSLVTNLDHTQAYRIIEEAHKSCPSSKELRGDSTVRLVADGRLDTF